jgi:hypothetical protein
MDKRRKGVPALPPRDDPSYSAEYLRLHWRKQPYKWREDLTAIEKEEQRDCYNRLLRELNYLSKKIDAGYAINWVLHYPVVEASKPIKVDIDPRVDAVSYSTGAKVFVWLRRTQDRRQSYLTLIGAAPKLGGPQSWSEFMRHRVRKGWRWHEFQFVFVSEGEGRLIKAICGPFVGNPEDHDIINSLRLMRADFNDILVLHGSTLPVIPSTLGGFLNYPLKCSQCDPSLQALPRGKERWDRIKEMMTLVKLPDPEPGEFLYGCSTRREDSKPGPQGQFGLILSCEVALSIWHCPGAGAETE